MTRDTAQFFSSKSAHDIADLLISLGLHAEVEDDPVSRRVHAKTTEEGDNIAFVVTGHYAGEAKFRLCLGNLAQFIGVNASHAPTLSLTLPIRPREASPKIVRFVSRAKRYVSNLRRRWELAIKYEAETIESAVITGEEIANAAAQLIHFNPLTLVLTSRQEAPLRVTGEVIPVTGGVPTVNLSFFEIPAGVALKLVRLLTLEV